jgi:diadenosine tetraphosphatase ApaH/serine/threonine PP2A family protein phosphatase
MTSSRRAFLKQTVGFSAAIALAAARPSAAAARSSAEQDGGAAQAASHLLAIGDFGAKAKDLHRQSAVSRAMAGYLRRREVVPDALLLLGDNFYGGLGGRGVRSARWAWNVEDMYPADAFDCPMYAVLGNHDYSDERHQATVQAELAYAKLPSRPRWTLPHKWYRFEIRGDDQSPLATVLVTDTNFVYGRAHWVARDERKRQLQWLAAELAKPRVAPWLFVLGHHPVYSDGHHGDSEPLVDEFDPLLRRHKVDLYLCGHDHDLQHLEFKGHPTSFVVSGAGGARARPVTYRGRGRFGRAVYGFTHLEVRCDRLAVRHIDANGVQLYGFRKSRGGRVTVL